MNNSSRRDSSVRPEVVEALQNRARQGSKTLADLGLPKPNGITIYVDTYSVSSRIAWLYLLQVLTCD